MIEKIREEKKQNNEDQQKAIEQYEADALEKNTIRLKPLLI